MDQGFILPFDRIEPADLPRVGGKGQNLGEMTRAGFPVPPGFCLTTDAFQRFVAASGAGEAIHAELGALSPDDLDGVRRVGERVRERLGAVAVPRDIEEAVVAAWEREGAGHGYAVRSSATAEDLPDASFAGQQDTYLNVRGRQALLDAVRSCWISLFTDRAIIYRAKHGFSHRDVSLSVVVQRMVLPDVSGILFTADPVSQHRRIVSIDAGYGLGEALVSGLTSADLYRVDKRDFSIVEIRVADKRLAIRPSPDGSTCREDLPAALRTAQALNEGQIRALAEVGARIEAHYGRPMDVEWCLEQGTIQIVQARPITTLFPLPEPRSPDGALRVYVSFGHAQVMTDPMPPMALSVWRLVFPFGRPAGARANPWMTVAAGRLYIDVSPLLRHPLGRRIVPRALANADKLIAGGVRQLLDRGELDGPEGRGGRAGSRAIARWALPLLAAVQEQLWRTPPEGTTARLSAHVDARVEAARRAIGAAAPGAARLKKAEEVLSSAFDGVWPMARVVAAGFVAKALLSRLVQGHADPADVEALARGLSGNVTTEMDLATGDLADAARRSPELARRFSEGDAAAVLETETAAQAPGGEAFFAAWRRFLERYGMRGPSEIDISRPRYRDEPGVLLQVVAGSLQRGEAGAHRAHHRRLSEGSEAAAARLIAAARRGALGAAREAAVRRLVRVVRNLVPAREHPKLLLVRTLDEVRGVLLDAARTLRAEGRIDAVDDIWFLELPEAIEALERPAEELRGRVRRRRAELERYRGMTPPRVLTSDGEIPAVRHAVNDLPAGALAGTPVSMGVAEGVARVVLDPHREMLRPREILVAPFTDPGWTPLFINAAALVMEVGGVMTHGSVVAREYGIPAVVGVLDATKVIRTGQRVRVDGTRGIVEMM
jgi:rifampicin phosphotransferase